MLSLRRQQQKQYEKTMEALYKPVATGEATANGAPIPGVISAEQGGNRGPWSNSGPRRESTRSLKLERREPNQTPMDAGINVTPERVGRSIEERRPTLREAVARTGNELGSAIELAVSQASGTAGTEQK